MFQNPKFSLSSLIQSLLISFTITNFQLSSRERNNFLFEPQLPVQNDVWCQRLFVSVSTYTHWWDFHTSSLHSLTYIITTLSSFSGFLARSFGLAQREHFLGQALTRHEKLRDFLASHNSCLTLDFILSPSQSLGILFPGRKSFQK